MRGKRKHGGAGNRSRRISLELLESRWALSVNALTDDSLSQTCLAASPSHSGEASAASTVDVGPLDGQKSYSGSVSWYAPTDWFVFDLKSSSQWSANLTGTHGRRRPLPALG